MSATTLAPRPVAFPGHPLLVIERILRDRDSIWRDIHREDNINRLIVQMLSSTAVANFFYGAVIGASNLGEVMANPAKAAMAWQILSSAIKLPILFLLTLAICLPTLYLFNLVFGSRLSVRQALAVVLVGITVTSMLTLAFAPISLFFLISAADYDFFKLLNVAILATTGAVGLTFLVDGMSSMNRLAIADLAAEAAANGTQVPPMQRPVNMSLIYLWIMLYGFVGTQLGWTLRPFFGDPGQEFVIFRSIKGNFYMNVIESLISLIVR
jgi:hypothetical protein